MDTTGEVNTFPLIVAVKYIVTKWLPWVSPFSDLLTAYVLFVKESVEGTSKEYKPLSISIWVTWFKVVDTVQSKIKYSLKAISVSLWFQTKDKSVEKIVQFFVCVTVPVPPILPETVKRILFVLPSK